MKSLLTLDEKKSIVIEHYQRAYKIKFKNVLSDDEVEFLHKEYLKLHRSEWEFKNAKLDYNLGLIKSI